MSRALSTQEVAQLDAMIERTSVSAAVSSIASHCSIKARSCSVFSNAKDTFKTQANILNNAVDKLPSKPKGY